MTTSNYLELKIIKGLPKANGDTLSGEPEIEVIDLGNVYGGFTVGANGWTPGVATIKNGGVWAESAVSPGRKLIAAERGNVVESMTLETTEGTREGRNYVKMVLNRMAEAITDFWEGGGQIQPIYLKWHAAGADEPQYAQLFTLQVSNQGDAFADNPLQQITISMEREGAWRALPPGTNPKVYAFVARGQTPSVDADWHASSGGNNDYQLVNFTDNFIDTAVSAIANRCEFNDSALGTLLTQNFIDIDAEDIPGDAPALVQLYVTTTRLGEPTQTNTRWFVGRRSTFLNMILKQNVSKPIVPPKNAFNAINAVAGTDITAAADTGAVKPDNAGAANRRQVTFATTTTNALRLQWSSNVMNNLVGKWAAFLRARQVNGAAGDINMYLSYGYAGGGVINLPVINPILSGTTGNTARWPLHYMGQIEFPVTGARALMDEYGLGVKNNASLADSQINLFASRPGGSTALLYVCDLILMPYDEAMMSMKMANTGGIPMLYDNTGYLSRGLEDMALSAPGSNVFPAELGGVLTLIPGEKNRLYFLVDHNGESDAQAVHRISVNIIPRWWGVRS